MTINLHDFLIVQINTNHVEKTVSLDLIDPIDSIRYQLNWEGVLKFVADEVGLQNVILEMKVFREDEKSFEYDRACKILGLESGKLNISEDKQTLIFIEASVGAELAALVAGPYEAHLLRQ